MAFRFGGKLLAVSAGRVYSGTSTTQIRGYCQQVSSTTDGFTFRRGAKLFIAGAVTALAVCHLWIGTKLDAAREEERARRLRWEGR